MSYPHDAAGAPPVAHFTGYEISSAAAPRRCYVYTAPATVGVPSNGGDIDGVSGGVNADGNVTYGYACCPGIVVRVEAHGTFSVGQLLRTNEIGRAQLATGGFRAVMRALEASSATGQLVWAVFITPFTF